MKNKHVRFTFQDWSDVSSISSVVDPPKGFTFTLIFSHLSNQLGNMPFINESPMIVNFFVSVTIEDWVVCSVVSVGAAEELESLDFVFLSKEFEFLLKESLMFLCTKLS